MCQIKISPCHLQKKKQKNLQQKLDQTPQKNYKKTKKKKKKQVSSWAGCIWGIDFPQQTPDQNREKTEQNRSVSGQAISGLWIFPGQVSPGFGQVPPKPR
jgi:hypothetical protein